MKQASTQNDIGLAAQFQRVLGKRIKSQRRESGLTQAQLSAHLNISRTALTNIEAGNQRVSTFLLARLAEILETPPGDLVPNLAEVESQLKQAQQTSVPSQGETKLLTRELENLNIFVKPEGTLKKALKEVRQAHKK